MHACINTYTQAVRVSTDGCQATFAERLAIHRVEKEYAASGGGQNGMLRASIDAGEPQGRYVCMCVCVCIYIYIYIYIMAC